MNRPVVNESSSLIAIDGGSTNTRVWFLREGRVLGRASAMVGVRDTARDGSPDKLHTALRQMIAQVRAEQPGVQPSMVAAAGMITSPLGLAEVSHVHAPASVEDLAKGARRSAFKEVADLPFWLFPGVRCGGVSSDDVSQTDVMRGEETLCVGLLASEHGRPPFTLLNLGSHWKLIQVDGAGRIARSRTTLSGELIHATQTATILAGGLPGGKLERLDDAWCEQGMGELRRSGLARALFCVRLLEMEGSGSPEQRMSFLIGAYVAADQPALVQSGFLKPESPVLLAGPGAVAKAWQRALTSAGIPARALADDEIESAFLSGICQLAQQLAV